MSVLGPIIIRRPSYQRERADYVGGRSSSSRGRGAVLLVALGMVLLAATPAAPADRLELASVRVVDASRSTWCAEEDNVYVPLSEGQVAHFQIQATHPAYIDRLQADNTAPDFRHCDMRADPSFEFEPRTVTLLDTGEIALIGHTFARFWRPERVPVRVGERTEEGLHLLQLFLSTSRGRFEFLVLYPSDGYWRLKPLPPAARGDNAYGSSFLVGPVEEQGRPLVRLTSVIFDPASRTFLLDYHLGGSGTVRLVTIDEARAVLEADLDPPVAKPRPFAALRSMFVSSEVADAAEVAWQVEPKEAWRVQPIGTALDQRATAVRFGRSITSRHNSSAPDLLFNGFRAVKAGR